MKKFLSFRKEKEESRSDLEKIVFNIRTRANREEYKVRSVMDLVSNLRNEPLDFRDGKGRINPKAYDFIIKRFKSLSDKISVSKNNLYEIGKDYFKICKKIREYDDEILLSVKKEIKDKVILSNKKLNETKALLDITEHRFFINNYDTIKENGFGIKLSKKKNRVLKPAVALTTSLLLAVLGISGFQKNSYINNIFTRNTPSPIEKKYDSFINNTYETVLPIRSFKDKDLLIEDVITSGKIPILMYHKIGVPEDRYTVSPQRFREHLEKLYEHNFQLISIEDYVNKDFSSLLPGKKPALITFDDADKGQFRFVTYKGKLMYDEFAQPLVDPECAVGILLDFHKEHPDFDKNAAFFIDFVNKYHDFEAPFLQEKFVKLKLLYLLNEGFEVCRHTYAHINLGRSSLEEFRKDEQMFNAACENYLGRKACLIENILAYPYGELPRNQALKTYIDSTYDATFKAWGGPAPNPYSVSPKTEPPPRIEISTNLIRDVLNKRNLLQKMQRGGN